MNPVLKFEKLWRKKRYACVGLDSEYSKIPLHLKKNPVDIAIFEFNKRIIDETFDLVCAYKPNSAFYEAYGSKGIGALKKTVKYIQKKAPFIPIILDAKRADIGNTNNGYVKFAFDELEVDAITVHPYLGMEAMEPFLERKEKLIVVLVKTSNPGADEFQDLENAESKPLYKIVAENVAKKWNKNKNCGVVVGATYPVELRFVRKIVGEMPILIPGIGAQGGDLKGIIDAGKAKDSFGMIIHSARAIIFASSEKDFAKIAREKTIELNNEIRKIYEKK